MRKSPDSPVPCLTVEQHINEQRSGLASSDTTNLLAFRAREPFERMTETTAVAAHTRSDALRAALAGREPALNGAAAPAKGLCLRRVVLGRRTWDDKEDEE